MKKKLAEEEYCILCNHALDVHKIQSYLFDKTMIEYSVRCENDNGVEGYKHCDCNMGFEIIKYKIKVERVTNV